MKKTMKFLLALAMGAAMGSSAQAASSSLTSFTSIAVGESVTVTITGDNTARNVSFTKSSNPKFQAAG